MIAVFAALSFAIAAAVTNLVQSGAQIYAVECAYCHGADLKGTNDGPTLQGSGAAAIDFMLRTGRMPLEVPGTEPFSAPPQLTPQQIASLTAYVVAHGAGSGPPIPAVHPDPARLARGRVLFDDNCQACHGALGTGSIAGFGWLAPNMHADTADEIADAIRIGPGVMPRFGPNLIDQSDLDALVTYVLSFRHPPDAGGLSLESAGPVGEGLFAWIFGVGGCCLVMVLVGETLRTTRHPPRDEPR